MPRTHLDPSKAEYFEVAGSNISIAVLAPLR